MNKSVRIMERQSLLDIALQECGNIEAAFDIALINKLSVTDYVPLFLVEIPQDTEVDEKVLNYYTSLSLRPATSPVLEVDLSDEYVDDDYWEDDYA